MTAQHALSTIIFEQFRWATNEWQSLVNKASQKWLIEPKYIAVDWYLKTALKLCDIAYIQVTAKKMKVPVNK